MGGVLSARGVGRDAIVGARPPLGAGQHDVYNAAPARAQRRNACDVPLLGRGPGWARRLRSAGRPVALTREPANLLDRNSQKFASKTQKW